MQKKNLIISIIVPGIIAVVFFGYVSPTFKEYKRVAQLPISKIELSEIDNGTYHGTYSYASRKIDVEVEVQNHTISKIDILERDNGGYTTKAAEQIPLIIIKQQNNSVDAISGATTSSKAILKAIENALVL